MFLRMRCSRRQTSSSLFPTAFPRIPMSCSRCRQKNWGKSCGLTLPWVRLMRPSTAFWSIVMRERERRRRRRRRRSGLDMNMINTDLIVTASPEQCWVDNSSYDGTGCRREVTFRSWEILTSLWGTESIALLCVVFPESRENHEQGRERECVQHTHILAVVLSTRSMCLFPPIPDPQTGHVLSTQGSPHCTCAYVCACMCVCILIQLLVSMMYISTPTCFTHFANEIWVALGTC